MRRYHIQQREDYQAYNRLCGSIRGLAHKLSQLADEDPFKTKYQGMLLSKLYDMGILDITAKIGDIESKVTVSALCRRRLAVVMCRLKMSETVSKVRPCHANSTGLVLTSSQGCTVHRAGARPRRTGSDHRSSFPRYAAYGRLRDLGGYQQAQTHGHAV